MDEAFGMSSNEQTGWKKRKTPNLDISNEANAASSTPVANTRGSRNKPNGAQGTAAQGHKQLTHLEDVVIMMAWEILTIKQSVGALRCGANFVVVLRDKNWKQTLAEVCEGWCAKQQENMRERLTGGHAQNEERPLGVSSHYFTKQPYPTRSLLRATQNCTLDGQKLDSRKWPNANLQFGTVCLGPSNQSTPSTRRTSHGHGWPLLIQTHHLNLWSNFRL